MRMQCCCSIQVCYNQVHDDIGREKRPAPKNIHPLGMFGALGDCTPIGSNHGRMQPPALCEVAIKQGVNG